MVKGEKFECTKCKHSWDTRGHGTKICPSCRSDDIMKVNTHIQKTIEEKKTKIMEARVEKERIIAEKEAKKEEHERDRKNQIKKAIGEKEYFQREAVIERLNLSEKYKEKLRENMGGKKEDFNHLLNQSKSDFADDKKKKNSLLVLGGFALAMFLFIPLFLEIIPQEKDNQTSIYPQEKCDYTKIIETDQFREFLMDSEEIKYYNITEIEDFVSGNGIASFNIVNKIPHLISIKVNYDLVHSGGSSWPNQEEFHNISSLETIKIVNTGSSGILWGTTSINNIKINYVSNDELEVESERIMEEVCKQCTGEDCLNDGVPCVEDLKCGSEICNIAGFCGKEKIVDCPKGKKNKKDVCMDNSFTKFKENYFKFVGILFLIVVFTTYYFMFNSKKSGKQNGKN